MSSSIKFDNKGLIPAIVQDHQTNEVLMMAYMSPESLAKTLETGETWFWSRSRKTLWHKGETSGHIQQVKNIQFDCDGDCLLIKVEQQGGIACHTGKRSCFHNALESFSPDAVSIKNLDSVLEDLSLLIRQRKDEMPEGSYTTSLFKAGVDQIAAKVEEESDEVILAAKEETKERVISEAADVLYHLIVLLAYREVSWEEVLIELKKRQR